MRGLIVLSNLIYITSRECIKWLFCLKPSQEFLLSYIQELSKYNTLYVKMFQAIALHSELIDEKSNDLFLQFTDNVPWSSDEIDYETILNICNEHSLTFEKKCLPIKSGMISLVFCLKKNDKNVILKLKRKNIDKKLHQGLNDLVSCLMLINWLPYIREMELYELIISQMKSFSHQLDFEQEVLNTNLMFSNFENVSYVIVPYVYENVTNKYNNAILMSCLQGVSIKNISDADHLQYAECVLKFAIVSCFVHGFAHGDLHPGNILFIKDDAVDGESQCRIGIIDMGITYRFDTHFKNQVFEITDKFLNGATSLEVAEQMIASGLVFTPIECIAKLPQNEYDDLLRIFTNFLEKSRCEPTDIIYKLFTSMQQVISYAKTKNLWKKTGVKISPEMVKLQMSFIMGCGITNSLCKNKGFTELVNECMNKIFHLDILTKFSLEL